VLYVANSVMAVCPVLFVEGELDALLAACDTWVTNMQP
jgi:hypothetical protein